MPTKLQRVASSSSLDFLNVPFKYMFNKFGFQHREVWTQLEIEKRSVRYWYVSNRVLGRTSYSMPTKLQRVASSSSLDFLNVPFKYMFNKFGFQHREGWTQLEIEKRSVRYWYVSIGKLG